MQLIQSYLSKIQSSLASGHATEHTYRPALKELFEYITEFTVHNEPKRSEHGAPDFIFLDGMIPMMYAEAKDIHISLDKIEKSEQLARYFGYPKLILTNGVEFRFYNNGVRYGEPIIIARKEGNMLDTFPEKFVVLENEMKAFISNYIDTIRSAGHLAKIMGGKAQRIRDNLREMMGNTERYPDIWKLYYTFKSEILHDLSHEDFADLYAQTLVYGLFVARYHDKTKDNFSRSEARDLVPKSNPLLRRFFDHIAGEGYEKRLEYIVDELCQVFVLADVHALMHGLYQKETHDPVIHFYEDFLGEYDDHLRKLRGVFYTPAPVVKFIIRAVDDVLKTHFNLPKGLADTSKIQVERELQKYDKKGGRKTEIIETHRVQILDPATGTGTFLDEIVRHIHSKMQGQAGMWPSYVNQDLLPRLHGFELMMASYTIAHLKLGLTLAETGVTDIDKRLQIYLTNSLEEAKVKKEDQGTLFGLLESITDEAKQADEVKRDKPIMVIVGNPPYSGESGNKGLFEKELNAYKQEPGGGKLQEKNSKWLNDDYVKFFRFAEGMIEKNKEGVIGFITNHSYLDNPTFRGMRWHLLQTFDYIYIVDLHGNTKKKETAPDGSKDENVFDIMQGTAIFVGIKTGKKKEGELAEVLHMDQYGKRKEKYDWLENNSLSEVSSVLELIKPHYFFAKKDFSENEEYEKGFSIIELMKENSLGSLTKRDNLAIDFTKDGLIEHIKDFMNPNETLENICLKFEIPIKDNDKWDAGISRTSFNIENLDNSIHGILYRPFDKRYINYSQYFVARMNSRVLGNFKKDNIGIVLGRQGQAVGGDLWNLIFITDNISDQNIFYRGGGTVLPLYLYPDTGAITPSLCDTPQGGESSKSDNNQGGEFQNRIPNLDPDIASKIAQSIGMVYFPDGCTHISSGHFPLEGCPKGGVNVPDDSSNILTPEQILDYIYAVLHSPSYREKYKEFLKIDFPRVPYPDALVRSSPSPSRGEGNQILSRGEGGDSATSGLEGNQTPSKEECRKVFNSLVALGGELRGLHLLESPKVEEYITTFPIAGTNEVEKIIARNSPLSELSQDDVSNSPPGGVSRSDGVNAPEAHSDGVNAPIDAPSWAKNSLFPYWSLPKNKNLKERSKELRKQGILSEVLFWQAFKDKEKLGWDIDRQINIGNYIVDFFIPELGLVFEIDGSSHEGREEYDTERDAFLLGLRLHVVHILDGDVKNNLEGVAELVYASIGKRKSELETITPPPIVGTPHRGEGSKDLLDIYINSTQYFGGVPLIAWEFYIGGYQPAQKWLKDRKGRSLTWEDISHYQSMIVALTETSRVMGEVDRVLES